MFVSWEGGARDVNQGLETVRFVHRQLRQNFPVKLNVFFHKPMHEVAVINLKQNIKISSYVAKK